MGPARGAAQEVDSFVSDEQSPKRSLSLGDVRSEPVTPERRSVLKLAGAALGGSVTALLGYGSARAQTAMPPRTGCNDQDTVYPQMPDGITHDYAGRGRRCNPQAGGAQGPSGCSDRDPTDGENFGRNCRTSAQPSAPPQRPPSQNPTGCNDSDPTDRPGYGVNCRGTTPPPAPSSNPSPGRSACTDRDPAPSRGGDASGHGRNCRATPQNPPVRPATCSDSDSGAGADPSGRGRRCR